MLTLSGTKKQTFVNRSYFYFRHKYDSPEKKQERKKKQKRMRLAIHRWIISFRPVDSSFLLNHVESLVLKRSISRENWKSPGRPIPRGKTISKMCKLRGIKEERKKEPGKKKQPSRSIYPGAWVWVSTREVLIVEHPYVYPRRRRPGHRWLSRVRGSGWTLSDTWELDWLFGKQPPHRARVLRVGESSAR